MTAAGTRDLCITVYPFEQDTRSSKDHALACNREPMTSLDKLAKMDGWDIGEDDTGASHKSESTGMREGYTLAGRFLSVRQPFSVCTDMLCRQTEHLNSQIRCVWAKSPRCASMLA